MRKTLMFHLESVMYIAIPSASNQTLGDVRYPVDLRTQTTQSQANAGGRPKSIRMSFHNNHLPSGPVHGFPRPLAKPRSARRKSSEPRQLGFSTWKSSVSRTVALSNFSKPRMRRSFAFVAV